MIFCYNHLKNISQISNPSTFFFWNSDDCWIETSGLGVWKNGTYSAPKYLLHSGSGYPYVSIFWKPKFVIIVNGSLSNTDYMYHSYLPFTK